MRRAISSSLNALICLEKSPCNACMALRAACTELASIRSAMASAWARSSLSFKKARSLNSPGRARRRPGSCRMRWISISNTTGPPWPCSSSTSSPVKEWGALKSRAMPWSSAWPCSSKNGRYSAWRMAGWRGSRAWATAVACGPDTRMIPTPPRPAAVAWATMVSRLMLAGRLKALFFHAAVDQPLLGHGHQVGEQPVEHQP